VVSLGLGKSEKPHDPGAYEMPRRVADTVAVLDELGVERAHFIGQSWGGRLGFGIGEHAPGRVRSLVIGGNQRVQFPDAQRARWLDNDPLALAAAWSTAMDEGAIADGLHRWRVPCLIFIGAADLDFLDGAHRAVDEIPNAELLLLAEADHYAAHVSPDEAVLEATLRVLRVS